MTEQEQHELDEQLWSDVMDLGPKLEKKIAHELPNEFVDSIIMTFDFFGASDAELAQMVFDLKRAKYKIYDWLAMMLNGRKRKEPQIVEATRKMARLYLAQKHVGGFAWWLKGHDMEVQEPKRCEDCILSYEDYMSGR